MSFDGPSSVTGGLNPFGDLVRGLRPADRQTFEAACERLEEAIRRSGATPAELLAEVPAEGPARRAVLIHLGKLWLEAQHDAGHDPRLDDLLPQIPELTGDPLAQRVLTDWANQLALGVTGPNPRFQGASFVLPEPYELLYPIQDDPVRMSVVLLVNNRRLARKEVLKALNPARLGNPTAVRRFLEEPARASQTQHPGIIRVYHASDESSPCPYYTMEYFERGSLAELLKAGPLSPVQAAKYLAIVARALHHVHATVGLAHGDIKPENILLNGDGDPKLTDFGLSRSAVPSDSTASASVELAGTPGYLAPEQLDPNLRPEGTEAHELRIASDLFALGATLYCCLTRRLPYQSQSGRPSPFAALANDLVPASQINPAVDYRLDAIIARCLQRRPEQRYATAAELADALEAWLARALLEPESITPPIPPKPKPPGWDGPLDEPDSSIGVEVPQTGWAAARSFLGRWEWAAVGGLLVLGTFMWMNAGNPGERFQRHEDVQVKSLAKENATGKTGEEPTTPASATTDAVAEALVRKGWERESAGAVAALNGPWLKLVGQVDPALAQRQVDALARLGLGGVSLDFCRESPEVAALLAGLVTDEEQRIAADSLTAANPTDVQLAQRLFSLHPSTAGSRALIRLFGEDPTLLRDLSRQGWVGPEAALFPSDDTEAERVYRAWLEGIVRQRLANATDDTSRRQAAEFLTFAVVSGPALKVRLGQDARFRARFLDEIWAPLVSLIDEGAFSVVDLLGVTALWDFLDREGSAGRDLLREYKLAPIALLYGPHADDFDGLHDRIVRLLTSKNKTLVKSLFNPAFRGRPAFRKLLEKDVPATVLAVALEESTQSPEQLDRFASLNPVDLAGELEPHWNPDAERNVEGRWVYVVVARKWLTGGKVYTYEQNALARQAAFDVAMAVLTYVGAGPVVEQGFDSAYWGAMKSLSDTERARRKAVLAASRLRLDPREVREMASSFAAQFEKPEDLVRLFEETRRMLEVVQYPSLNARGAGSVPVAFDAGAVARMYKAVLGGTNPRESGADRPDVRLLLIDGGRLAVGMAPGKEDQPHPVRDFFNSRADQALRASADDEKALRAWRESASAWWLIHATRQLDLLDH